MEIREEMIEVRNGANLATSVTLPGSASYSVIIVRTVYRRSKAVTWVTMPVSANTSLYDAGVLGLHHALPWVISLPLALDTQGSLDEFHLRIYEKIPLIYGVDLELDALWNDMLQEGPASSFWTENNLEHYIRECKVPEIRLGGWYDFLLDATLGPYQVMAKSGIPQRLALGPWSHNGIVGNEKIAGDIWYGCDNGMNDEVSLSFRFVQESVEWLDYWMKDSGDLFSGSGGYDRYTYDPWNPAPTEEGTVWTFPKSGSEPGPCVSHVHSRRATTF